MHIHFFFFRASNNFVSLHKRKTTSSEYGHSFIKKKEYFIFNILILYNIIMSFCKISLYLRVFENLEIKIDLKID